MEVETVACLAEAQRNGFAYTRDFVLNDVSWEIFQALERNGEIIIVTSGNNFIQRITYPVTSGNFYITHYY